jgi:hypothetical protein
MVNDGVEDIRSKYIALIYTNYVSTRWALNEPSMPPLCGSD